MMRPRAGLATMLAGALFLIMGSADAADTVSDGFVKIGVLTDMSGAYSATGGPGSLTAAKMAIQDFGGTVLGQPIKLVEADHQNKPDLGASIARKWIDTQGVDMITGLINSAVGLAVQDLADDKHIIAMNIGDGSTQLTEEQCSRYGIHYVYDTYSLPVGTATAVVGNGGKRWFFIANDYAFGHSLEENTKRVLDNANGEMLGSLFPPLGTHDFSSYLLQAQSSGAQVLGLGVVGTDFINAVKQAHEFGIVQGGQRIAAMLTYVTTIKSLGLKTAQGLEFTTAFYWDRTAASRKWSKRFLEKTGKMPTMLQAGTYSAVSTYLKAVQAAGTDEADAVRDELGAMTIHDFFTADGHIEANGLMRHDMYLVQVKKPAASDGPWDLLKVVSTIPGDQAFIPLSESSCPLLDN